MSVKIHGLDKLLRDLESRLGTVAMQKISDKALLDAAEIFVDALKREFASFRDTGGSIEEITISPIMLVNGVRTIKIHWSGPKGRYRIIHLNEWGTIKNPRPRGKGAIARTLNNAKKAYQDALKKAIKEAL
ncbi:hypothetical protein ACQCU1_12635 [Sutcliffiella horikoshii]|uniref:hypothetical protein n=1 Tax=Sutcliffiella horikoshii TaxID=79883 RepID=UPI003CEF69D5